MAAAQALGDLKPENGLAALEAAYEFGQRDLAYVARAVREGRVYRIYGYKGKQVRDNLHSFDVCAAFLEFYKAPRSGAVYNLGGGRANSVSVLEAIERCQDLVGKSLTVEYVEASRLGDHISYISDLRRLRADYPGWQITRSLDDIFREAQKGQPTP